MRAGVIKTTVSLDELKNGDTVEIGGQLETVSLKYLKHCSFMGRTYKGHPYRQGITRVRFVVPTAGGVRYA